jgi:polyferredoxin
MTAGASAPDDEDAAVEVVSLYQKAQKIYPRAVSGWFIKWRWALVFLTQLVFYGLPWLMWNDRQAVLFDLASRRFYIFNLVLYPQDFIYLTGILVISAYSLFLFTAVAGRLWCGYACPQTVYTEIFMWVERKLEGDRSARMKLDAAPWSLDKLWRKGGKHLIWVVLALWTGFTLVGYFTPIQDPLVPGVHAGLRALGVVLGPVLQLCHLGQCRLHARAGVQVHVPLRALPERDVRQGHADHQLRRRARRAARLAWQEGGLQGQGLGACIDCNLCVQVCPTGIDIRKGLQYECIGCAACIDVCDGVMDKMNYPRGLVRYATQNSMANHWTSREMWRRVFRPRVLVYTGVLILILAALLTSIALRSPFRVDIVRDRGALARIVDEGRIENVYRLQIMNAAEQMQHYQVRVSGLEGATVVGRADVEIGSAEARWLPVSVQVPPEAAARLTPGAHAITFEIERRGHDADPPVLVTEKSTFVIPR